MLLRVKEPKQNISWLLKKRKEKRYKRIFIDHSDLTSGVKRQSFIMCLNGK